MNAFLFDKIYNLINKKLTFIYYISILLHIEIYKWRNIGAKIVVKILFKKTHYDTHLKKNHVYALRIHLMKKNELENKNITKFNRKIKITKKTTNKKLLNSVSESFSNSSGT